MSNLIGTSGDDTLKGGSASDLVKGLDGDDLLYGNQGDDSLIGGAGDDTLRGGFGDDLLTGGGGIDTASYFSASVGVSVSLLLTTQNTGFGIDTLQSIENLTGSKHSDVLTGDTHANVILGEDGQDTLSSGGGADLLEGGAGFDDITASGPGATLAGGDDNDLLLAVAGDTLEGGAGLDTAFIDLSAMTHAVDLKLGHGQIVIGDTSLLTMEQFTIQFGSGDDTVRGGAFSDALDGGDGDDRLTAGGNPGSPSTLYGGAGNDRLTGGVGNDWLNGGGGDDDLFAKAAQYLLTGGSGADTFHFSELTTLAPTISDLQNADRIDLRQIDANAVLAGDQAFVLVSAFTHHAGELTLSYDAGRGRTVIAMDDDGDGVADGMIWMSGDHHSFHALVL